jgi:hypothetical protein
MISVNVPGMANIIMSALLKIIYIDLLMVDDWFIPLVFPDEDYILEEDEENSNKDEALNPFFNENGFQSKTLIKNLGSTFIYLMGLFALMFVAFLFWVFDKAFSWYVLF